MVEALCGVVALRTMPVGGLWTAAWLLLQLLPRPEPQAPAAARPNPGDAAQWGSHLSVRQRGVLARGWRGARDHLMEQMCGARACALHGPTMPAADVDVDLRGGVGNRAAPRLHRRPRVLRGPAQGCGATRCRR